MKYLQIYDHLGNLVKEFEVFVDGDDFNWAAPKPEPVWLGTIRLSATKAAEAVEPTPEPEPEKLMLVTQYLPEVFEHQLEPEGKEPEVDEDYEAAVADLRPEFHEPEPEPEAEAEAEVPTQPPFTTPEKTTETKPEDEVKHDTKKRSHKSSRGKGTRPQSRSKGS